MLAKQALDHVTHTSSPFYSGYSVFEMGSQKLFAWAGLELQFS
jgi:hypothetical protein